MRDGRKSLVLLAAPLALLSLSGCGGDTEGTSAEGEYDPDAPSLEEVSSDADLANVNDSIEEPVTNSEVAE